MFKLQISIKLPDNTVTTHQILAYRNSLFDRDLALWATEILSLPAFEQPCSSTASCTLCSHSLGYTIINGTCIQATPHCEDYLIDVPVNLLKCNRCS